MANEVIKDIKKQKTSEEKGESTHRKTNKALIMILLCLGVLGILLGSFYQNTQGKGFFLNKMLHSIEGTSINWRFDLKKLSSFRQATLVGTHVQEREGYYNRIYICGITADTLAQLGEWPFDRKYHAQLINHLNQLPNRGGEPNKRVLLFDILFGVEGNPESDQLLIDAVADYDGIIAEDFILDSRTAADIESVSEEAAEEHLTRLKMTTTPYDDSFVQAVRRFELNPKTQFLLSKKEMDNIYTFDRQYLILPSIASNLDVCGPPNVDTSFGITRKIPLVIRSLYSTNYLEEEGGELYRVYDWVDVYYPNIVLAMAAKILGSHISNIVVKPGEIVIKNTVVEGKTNDVSIPVDERFQLLINYKATENDEYVTVLPYHDVLRGGLPNDAIILVGMYAKGAKAVQDIKVSPLGNMFGILHLAYALGTILNQDYIRAVPHWVNILYIALLSLIVALLISRGTRFTIIAGLIAIVIPIVVGFVLFLFGIEILMIIPLFSTVLTLIAGEIFLLLTEEKEKRFIKTTFSSYVNPELVEILIKNPEMLKMGGESKELTILFSDIRGFTTISEGMTPEYLITFLNEYLTGQTEVVMKTRGTLDKYIGDAVMAFWNAPIEIKNHPLVGCQAAVMMIERMEEFNKEHVQRGDIPINIGIGINTGLVKVGNVGSKQRKNYTCIGDHVNLASRLEAVNKQYKTNIIISEYTYQFVKDDVIARELDYITVKGKTRPVRIYELIDVKNKIEF